MNACDPSDKLVPDYSAAPQRPALLDTDSGADELVDRDALFQRPTDELERQVDRCISLGEFDAAAEVVAYATRAVLLWCDEEIIESAVRRLAVEEAREGDEGHDLDDDSLVAFLAQEGAPPALAERALVVSLAGQSWTKQSRVAAVAVLAARATGTRALLALTPLLAGEDRSCTMASELILRTLEDRSCASAPVSIPSVGDEPADGQMVDAPPTGEPHWISVLEGLMTYEVQPLEASSRVLQVIRSDLHQLAQLGTWEFGKQRLKAKPDGDPFLFDLLNGVHVVCAPEWGPSFAMMHSSAGHEMAHTPPDANAIDVTESLRAVARAWPTPPDWVAPSLRRQLVVATYSERGAAAARDQVHAALACESATDADQVCTLALKGLLQLISGSLEEAGHLAGRLQSSPESHELKGVGAAWMLLFWELSDSLCDNFQFERVTPIDDTCRALPGHMPKSALSLFEDAGAPDATSLTHAGEHADALVKQGAWQRSLAALIRAAQTLRLRNRGRYAHAVRVGAYSLRLAEGVLGGPPLLTDRLRAAVTSSEIGVQKG